MRQELSAPEKQALQVALQNPELTSALVKFCTNHEEYHTRKVREQQNVIPKSVDADTERRALGALHGGMAKAYGTMFAELGKAAE